MFNRWTTKFQVARHLKFSSLSGKVLTSKSRPCSEFNSIGTAKRQIHSFTNTPANVAAFFSLLAEVVHYVFWGPSRTFFTTLLNQLSDSAKKNRSLSFPTPRCPFVTPSWTSHKIFWRLLREITICILPSIVSGVFSILFRSASLDSNESHWAM